MSATPVAAPPKSQLLELTSVRFFAAMAVLLGHFNEFMGIPDWIAPAFAGGFGVSFFFVLSGFILCYVYAEPFDGGVTKEGYQRFASARFARIYPSYVMALLLITVMYDLMNWVRRGSLDLPPNPVTSWLANLLALQTFAPSWETQQFWNGPSWSISTEFGFYVLCPFILASTALHLRSAARLVLLLVIAMAYSLAMQALALYLVYERGWNQQFWVDVIASRNIFWRIPEFLAGVVMARLLYGGHLAWLQSAAARNALLLACLIAVTVINLAPWPSDPKAFIAMRQLRFEVAYTLPFAGIIVALAAGPTFLSPLLRRPSWVFLGDISYGIYIYHWIPWTILAHAKAHGLPLPLWLVTGVIAGTIMFSAASYLWYERPVRLYLRKKLGH